MENYETSNKEIGTSMMPIEDMWALTKGDKNWGIEGYDPLRKYYDCKQAIKDRELAQTLKETKKFWPPSNWPKNKDGKQEPPKRPNYLDQIYKWSNSYYDHERAQKVTEDLESKGRPFDKKKEAVKTDPKKIFETSEKEKEDRKANFSDYPKFDLKIEWIEKAKERIKSQTTKWEKDAKENKKKGGMLPTADRITVVSDAQYLGEKTPFYNTFKKEGEESNENTNNKKKKKNLFFPDKTSVWNKAPAWVYPEDPKCPLDKTKPPQEIRRAEPEDDGEPKKKYDPLDVSKAFRYTVEPGRFFGPFKYHEKIDLTKIDPYNNWKENNPPKYVGPQHYFKTLPFSKNSKKKPKSDEEGVETGTKDKQKFVYLDDPRSKAEKRIYKPMRSFIY